MNRARFRRLLRAVLLSGPFATLGCDGVADPTEMPDRAQRVDLHGQARYAALTLGRGVDGIAFAARPCYASTGEPTFTRLASAGTPCATASNPDDCSKRVDARRRELRSGDNGCVEGRSYRGPATVLAGPSPRRACRALKARARRATA